MNKKIFVWIFVLIILSFSVFAVPPVTTIFTGDTGMQVEVNIMENYKLGEARFSIIHLFNISDGNQYTNATHPDIMCELHLRNSQGFEIMKVNATVHENHWDLNGSAGGSNSLGLYAWTIVCNDANSKTGGYTSGIFEITKSGRNERNEFAGMLNIAMVIALGLVSFLFIYFSFNLDNDHFILKMFLIFFGLINLILIPSTMINGYSNTTNSFLKLVVSFFGIFIIYFSIYIFWHWCQKSEEMMTMIDKASGAFKRR